MLNYLPKLKHILLMKMYMELNQIQRHRQRHRQKHTNTIREPLFLYVFVSIPLTAFFFDTGKRLQTSHKVPSAPSLRQKTPPIAGIVPSFENAENSQVCCPWASSRHPPHLQAAQCLYSCATTTATLCFSCFLSIFD